MSIFKGSAVCLAVFCLSACADPPPPQKTVFDPVTQQLDRAREVQHTVDQNTEQTRQAIDNQERGDSPDRSNGPDHGDDRR
jgi:ABC-type transporter MlaC component